MTETELLPIEKLIEWCSEKSGLLSFHEDAVLCFYPYELVKSKLKEGVTREKFEEISVEYNRTNVIKEMNDYISFAIEKAENQRGISATRSMQKFQTWLHALGDTTLSKQCEEWEDYGMQNLLEIKKKYNLQ